MPEANESIAPFTLLGGILYLNEFELLPGLSADACRNIGRLRRKAVSAHLVGDRKRLSPVPDRSTVWSKQTSDAENDSPPRKVGRHRNRNRHKRRRTLVPDTMPNTDGSRNSS